MAPFGFLGLAPHAEPHDAGRAGAMHGVALHHRRAAAATDRRHEAFVRGAAGGFAGRIQRAKVCHGAWRSGWSRRPVFAPVALGPGHPTWPSVASRSGWARWSCCAGIALGPGHPARAGIANCTSGPGRSNGPGFALVTLLTLLTPGAGRS